MTPRTSDHRHPHAGRARRSLVLGVLVLAAVVSPRWLRINVSPSVPLGLYRLAPVPAPLVRGTLVLLPVPPRVRAWHAAWVPVLKPVAGLPGERGCHQDHHRFVHGVSYGPVLPAAQGKALPHIEGCLVVQEGEVLLASPVPRSFDARDLGPGAVTAVTATAHPLRTWR